MTKKEAAVPGIHATTLIPISCIQPSPAQTRKRFIDIESLAENMKAVGLLQPVVVRKMSQGNTPQQYELVTGERRLRAAKLIPWKMIPAIAMDLTDDQAHLATVTENLQRNDLTPMEEGRGVAVLLNNGCTLQQVSDKLGRSPGWVARRSKLNDLSGAWQEELDREGSYISTWPAACLELVARIAPKDQDAFLKNAPVYGARPTAEQIDHHLRDNYMRNLTDAGFDITADELILCTRSCHVCETRTGAQPDLFDDQKPDENETVSELGRCLNLSCWLAKERATRDIQFQAAEAKYGDCIRTLSQGYYGKSHTAPWSKDVETRRIKNEWEWQSCKKTDAGATPVLVIDGKDRGKVRWMKPTENAARREKSAKEKARREDPVVVAEQARLTYLVDLVVAKLQEMEITGKYPDILQTKVMAYTAVFGLSNNENDAPATVEEDWDTFDKYVGDAALCREKLLGNLIAEIGESSWRWNDSLNCVKRICELVGLKYDELYEQALEAVPVPTAPADTKAEPEQERSPKARKKARK